ncbi:hypothetical protein [Aridibaculum aurantiacum]|uniref:hypothetical protein n=1 Tax=Aridibaculum aurantiacum TaxID=2810307 RepID=UPI001A96B8EB|nr:hypothetical protein [Aridibaculum aurantiacum]
MDMLKLMFACFTIAFAGACTTARQGVEGKVVEVSGNMMPGPGVTLPKGTPLQTSVLITIALAENEVKRNQQGLYEKPQEKLVVKQVRTDANGNFKATLSPGVYSVFIETPDGWFANETDGNSVLNKITVENKQIIQKNITVNYRAAY